jgi:ABC-type transporter Mla subunit MlaD
MADSNDKGGRAPQTSEILEEAQSIASKVADTAQEKVRGFAQTAEDKARQLAEDKKREAAEQVESVARVIDGVAEQVERVVPPASEYVRGVSEQIHRVSSTLRDRSVDELMEDVRYYAQQRPGLVLGGCLIAGFGLARFLKASADRRSDERMRRHASSRAGASSGSRRPPSSRSEYPSDVAVEGAPASARPAPSAGPASV